VGRRPCDFNPITTSLLVAFKTGISENGKLFRLGFFPLYCAINTKQNLPCCE
jgi:hypothetical protein